MKPNPTKRAAELAKDDLVQVGNGDWRYVLTTAFTEHPIDATGTTGVRIWWKDHEKSSIVAADKEMAVAVAVTPIVGDPADLIRLLQDYVAGNGQDGED